MSVKFNLQRNLTRATLAIMLMFYGSVSFADGFGDLGDVTMQVIGPDEIPSDIIQNIHIPELDQTGINGNLPSALSTTTPGVINRPLANDQMIVEEAIPFDRTIPLDSGAFDPGMVAPPLNVDFPTEGMLIDPLHPIEPRFINPDGALK